MLEWRSLWRLFSQAVAVFVAAAFVFTIYNALRRDLPSSYSDAISRVSPSVVSIYGRNLINDSKDSTGAGVIISADGYIITNYHLIANVEEIEIGLQNGRTYLAKMIGIDPDIDIAVLHIDAIGLPAVNTADDALLAPGDIVFAIGNPFGLDQSATMGIVSALGRNRLGLHNFEHFIQTDAAINPGSSGGALANAHGQLVGINSALFYRQRGVIPQGIGFAVPAGLAVRSYQRLVKQNTPPPNDGWGMEIRQMPSRLRNEVFSGNEGTSPVLVSRIWDDSPAFANGILVGDIILSVDGNAAPDSYITDSNGLKPMAKRIVLFRHGEKRFVNLTSK